MTAVFALTCPLPLVQLPWLYPMRRTVQLVRLVSVACCKRSMSKAEVAVLLVFVVGYFVAAWLLAKAN
jgi:hypothetical protein